MKTYFLESTDALRNELTATKESLSEKENTIDNLEFKLDLIMGRHTHQELLDQF